MIGPPGGESGRLGLARCETPELQPPAPAVQGRFCRASLLHKGAGRSWHASFFALQPQAPKRLDCPPQLSTLPACFSLFSLMGFSGLAAWYSYGMVILTTFGVAINIKQHPSGVKSRFSQSVARWSSSRGIVLVCLVSSNCPRPHAAPTITHHTVASPWVSCGVCSSRSDSRRPNCACSSSGWTSV